jgi:hypothetical protein
MNSSSRFAIPLLAAAFGAAAAADKPEMPAAVASMVQEHLGSWQTSGFVVEGDRKTSIKAQWSCERAAGGPGLLCTWHHEWADGSKDTNLEFIGYDDETGRLTLSRLREDGTVSLVFVDTDGRSMTRTWEFDEGGRKAQARNHIVVRESGWWEQHVTISVDGKLIREMRLTQRRVAAAPVR